MNVEWNPGAHQILKEWPRGKMGIEEAEESTRSGVTKPKEFKIQEGDWDDQQNQIHQKNLVNQSMNVKETTGFMD